MSKQNIKIIVADDHQMFLDGLLALLKQVDFLEVVSVAINGNELLKLLTTKKVDLLITDVDMPGISGPELVEQIRKQHPELKIITLTMHNYGPVIETMLKKGVNGYILKDSGKQELLKAIETVMSGENYYSEEIKNTILNNMGSRSKKITGHKNLLEELSSREKEILGLIAQEKTQQEIADLLFISPHTVVFHRRKLLQKLDVKNTAGLIRKALEYGLLD